MKNKNNTSTDAPFSMRKIRELPEQIDMVGAELTEVERGHERGLAYRALLALLPEKGAMKLMSEVEAISSRFATRYSVIAEYLRQASRDDSNILPKAVHEAAPTIEAANEHIKATLISLDLNVEAIDALARMEPLRRYRTDLPMQEGGISENAVRSLLRYGLITDCSSDFSPGIKAYRLKSSGLIASQLLVALIKTGKVEGEVNGKTK